MEKLCPIIQTDIKRMSTEKQSINIRLKKAAT
jgi:hypothetical protein